MHLYQIINYRQKDRQDALAQLAMVQIIIPEENTSFRVA